MGEQKWIFYCNEAGLIFAARAAEKLCRSYQLKCSITGNATLNDFHARYEFDNGVIMDGHATETGTFVVRQVDG